jgi:hypothetical protein
MFLNAMRYIQARTITEKTHHLESFCHYLCNGGEWIIANDNLRKNINQMREQLIAIDSLDYSSFERRIIDDEIIEQLEAQGDEVYISNLREIQVFMETLPYIITVSGDHELRHEPFIICHADLPYSDRELLDLKSLDDEAKKYITWARPIDFRSSRMATSIRVYCGHNIISDPEYILDGVVRRSTNTINLDGGAYLIAESLVVNATHNEAFIVTTKDAPVSLVEHVRVINEYMQNYDRDVTFVLSDSDSDSDLEFEILSISTVVPIVADVDSVDSVDSGDLATSFMQKH